MTPEERKQFNEHFSFVTSVLDILQSLGECEQMGDVSGYSVSRLAREAEERMFHIDHIVKNPSGCKSENNHNNVIGLPVN